MCSPNHAEIPIDAPTVHIEETNTKKSSVVTPADSTNESYSINGMASTYESPFIVYEDYTNDSVFQLTSTCNATAEALSTILTSETSIDTPTTTSTQITATPTCPAVETHNGRLSGVSAALSGFAGRCNTTAKKLTTLPLAHRLSSLAPGTRKGATIAEPDETKYNAYKRLSKIHLPNLRTEIRNDFQILHEKVQKFKEEKEAQDWSRSWVKCAKDSPPNLSDFIHHFEQILQNKKHPLFSPLTASLAQLSVSVAATVSTDIVENAATISDLVSASCAHMAQLALSGLYSALNSTCPEFVERAMLELIFYRLHDTLWPRYCAKYVEEDNHFMKQVKLFKSITPAHFNIPSQFHLSEGRMHFALVPYCRAIQEAQQIESCKTPWEKVQCLITVGKSISHCISDFWSSRTPRPSLEIGIIHAASCAKYIEHFLPQEDLCDEQGYLLITFQTALSYISLLQPEELLKTPQPQSQLPPQPHSCPDPQNSAVAEASPEAPQTPSKPSPTPTEIITQQEPTLTSTLTPTSSVSASTSTSTSTPTRLSWQLVAGGKVIVNRLSKVPSTAATAASDASSAVSAIISRVHSPPSKGSSKTDS